MIRTFARLSFVGPMALCAAAGLAQPVLVNTPTTINPGDTMIAGVPLTTAQITVRGTTLTVNGRHTIASLVVERQGTNIAGVVTHAPDFRYTDAGQDRYGMHLIVTGNVTVQGIDGTMVASRIDANGKGHLSDEGTGPGTGSLLIDCAGGGGHGGAGGRSRVDCSDVAGGVTYGSISAPIFFGSGGGRDNSGLGGTGGGSVTLDVQGTLTLNGNITANGSPHVNESGGGAGGSVYITAQSLTGIGSLSVNGGSSNTVYGGGGGGGRLAVHAASSSFTGSFNSRGGDGIQRGGAGTSYFKVGSDRATLWIDNGGATDARENTEFEGQSTIDANVVVRNGGRIGPRRGESGMHVTITGDLTIQSTGGLHADGYGYASDTGPGAGPGAITTDCAGGGGHGGAGGRSRVDCSDVDGGVSNGSFTQPTMMGSGGGRDNSSLGGAGGGAIQLTVQGTYTHDGTATAHGSPGVGQEAGGGAGGSIYITCRSFGGSGSFAANGGNANIVYSGGGGGGRIAVYALDDSTFSGTFMAAGGNGQFDGGAGTSFYKVADARATMWLDNNGTTGQRETTEFYGLTEIDADVVVRGGARLGPRREQEDFHLVILGGLTVESGGEIFGDHRGYPSDAGPGAGVGGITSSCSSGGGHGGSGGRTRYDCTDLEGGRSYGSITEPSDMGSGGAQDNSYLGGRGGGAIRMDIAGDFVLDGRATTTGQNAIGTESGGGAGGSVWITCDTFSGTGLMTADGGDANLVYAGGGAGGRIAVYAATSASHSGTFRASGGNAHFTGGAGTALVKNGNQRAVVFIDNNNRTNLRETTELTGPLVLDADVVVRGGARLGPRREQMDFKLTVLGDMLVDATGEVYADGRGYPSDTGPGAGVGGLLFSCASGGGFGGVGGAARDTCSVAAGGLANGDESNPLEMGSGGGRDNTYLGGAGGGLIDLTVDGTLTIDGRVGADGAASIGAEAGGGSGGGIAITCGSLLGTGTITAKGGNANVVFAGAGGGGRVAIYSCDRFLPPANVIVTRGDAFNDGQNGSIYYGSSGVIITQQPLGGDYRSGDFFQLNVQASSVNSELTYQWRKKNEFGVFVPLIEGQNGGVFTNVDTNTLFVSSVSCDGGGQYDCIVCDSCGCLPTDIAQLNVQATGDFNGDGGIDGSDVAAFFEAWETGDAPADVNSDGGIDGSDVEWFFERWEAGC